jgi:hypothetical protein
VASRTWPAYVGVATAGYLLYTLGAVGPYLRSQLGLTGAEVGLHSTAVAAGLMVAGLFAADLARRFGELRVRGTALVALLIAGLILIWAPALGATLAAAASIGFGVGTVLGYANATLGEPGGRSARIHLARSGVWGILAGFVGPAVVAAGASMGPGWWLGLLPGVGLVALIVFDLRSGAGLEVGGRQALDPAQGRLPRDFWLAWIFLVAAIAVEFTVVFWAATLVERRDSVLLPEATAVGTLFVGGMLAGRLALSGGLGAGQEIRRTAGVGLALALAGACLAWVSTSVVLSGIGLFVTGLGVSVLYPLGIAAAVASAPGQPALAGVRLTMATGTALLFAPFALGAIADLTGVVAGWILVPGLIAVGSALLFGLPRERVAGAAIT